MNNKAIFTHPLRAAIAALVLCLTAISASAQSNVVVRVMSSNLTGDSQFYGTPEIDILKGLKADVVAMQEFQYSSTTSNGVNTPAAIREMVDNAFGTNFFYFRENYTGNGDIPNGIISRYPILASGSFVDTQVGNRGFAWAQIDLPGTNDLYVVSVHLLTTSSGARATEASNLTTLIQANFPANAWIIVAGDFNTGSRSEACMTTFEAYLSDNPIPVDNNGNSNTSGPRSKPHDYVLPSFPMTNALTSVVLGTNTFPNGLVFDSRVYTPLSDVPPVVTNDSANAQHMGVFKDFLVPVQMVSGTLLSVTPGSGLSSLGHVGGPFSPSNQVYSLVNSGNSNMDWVATNTAAWVTVSPTNGTLASGASTNVRVSINGSANSLSAGGYSDTVVFTNTTNGAGSTTRPVSLTVESTFPVIVTNGWTLSVENCTPGNGVVDPGETVTVNFSVKNTGTADTTNLVATLLGTSDVNLPSNPQAYGVVSINGTPVSQPFSFTAGGSCGGVITATLQLQDGAANLGTISYSIPVGLTATVFTQNFDSVTAPSLPAGWATSASGAQSNWVTSTTLADTAPNAAFSPDPNSVGVNELDTPTIAINSAVAQLTFRQNYNLAVSTTNSTLGDDGGVLEIAIGGGSYNDIIAAGGSFASGGYNTTLSGDFSNPLAGRQAWSGNSGGFVTTVVNLPASAAGQNIQLRWRSATGNTPGSVTSSGTLAYWNFDGSTQQPALVMTNITASPVATSNTGAITFPNGNPSTGQAISTSGFSTSAGPPTTSTSCFTFSLVVSNGSQAILSSLSFDDQRSGTGPTNFTVQISQTADFSSGIYTSAQQTSHTVIASGANSIPLALSNLTGTIYFRLYGYKAGASGGTWRIDNLNIQGSVTSAGSTVGSGWYVDSVSIQDAFCCTNFANPPVADFTGSPTSGSAPLMVTFNDASSGTVTNWFWDFGDSISTNVTTNSVVHTYAAGTYGVTLIVTGPDGVGTNTKAGYITAWTPFQTWQVQYFGSTDNPAAAGSFDADGDGQNNLAEFLAGTDPTNSVSALRITAIARQGNDLRVTWTTGIGKTNALQFTTGTVGGSYSNNFADLFIVTNTTDTVTNYLDLGATSGATRYYRVLLVP
jgi:PKD repeat protein/endonuclease/exonuclease/phosphatase family metal-dependent hydrolase